MSIEIPRYTPDRDNRAGRPSGKQRVLDYIAARYAETKQPVCLPDMNALPVSKDTCVRAVRDLCAEGVIKYVGLSGDSRRDDLESLTIRMYAPSHAPMLIHAPIVKADGTVKAARAVPYIAKPEPVSPPRPKVERYRGERGAKYVPEFREMSEGAYDLRAHQKLAMLAR